MTVSPRTRRACEESMAVVAKGDATGMFDVYSGGRVHVVDLGGDDDRCTCEDMEYNLTAGERCKHVRRVRLEFALPPFEEVPEGIRSEYAAPTDVELARRRRGIDVEPEPEPEPDAPEPITVGEAKPARRVATDGGRAKCVECGSFLPDEIEDDTDVYCPDCGHGQHVRTDGGQETGGESEQACARHDIDALPSGYDRCPYCERERHREALIEHEMTRDPTLEPW